jgi:hypothetical protein
MEADQECSRCESEKYHWRGMVPLATTTLSSGEILFWERSEDDVVVGAAVS